MTETTGSDNSDQAQTPQADDTNTKPDTAAETGEASKDSTAPKSGAGERASSKSANNKAGEPVDPAELPSRARGVPAKLVEAEESTPGPGDEDEDDDKPSASGDPASVGRSKAAKAKAAKAAKADEGAKAEPEAEVEATGKPKAKSKSKSDGEDEEEEPEPERSWDDLDLPDHLRSAIAAVGWERPTQVQTSTFATMVAGKDIMVQSQTGSGKTGAFCLPWLASRFEAGPAKDTGVQLIVLLPTRELAKQVCAELVRLAVDTPVDVLPVYGGTAMQPQLDALKAGVHAVVGTPGRILDHIRRRSLDLSKVRTVVLDECDEMLSMGFLEDIRSILSACPKQRQTCLFSATVPREIERIARRHMDEPERIELSGDEIAAAEIDHAFYSTTSTIKTRDLLDVVIVEDPAAAIVFCNTREETRLVANVLRNNGYSAHALSSDLTQAAREKVMGRFRDRKLRFLVATDVAARGIDVSHVSHVINYSFPENAEVYVHRTGRTGRAGRAGVALSIVSPQEIGSFYTLTKSYKSIQFTERKLPPKDELAATRTEVKLDRISHDFSEPVSPEWLLLARRLAEDPRGERVVAYLLYEAIEGKRLGKQDEDDEDEELMEMRERRSDRDRGPRRGRGRDDDRGRRRGRDDDRGRGGRGRRRRDDDDDRGRSRGRDQDRDKSRRRDRSEDDDGSDDDGRKRRRTHRSRSDSDSDAKPEADEAKAEAEAEAQQGDSGEDKSKAEAKAKADPGDDDVQARESDDSEDQGEDRPKKRRRRKRRRSRSREDDDGNQRDDDDDDSDDNNDNDNSDKDSGRGRDEGSDGEDRPKKRRRRRRRKRRKSGGDESADDDDSSAETEGADDRPKKRRRRRRRRRRKSNNDGSEQHDSKAKAKSDGPRVSQDQIVIDIDEQELDEVRNQFGEIDELDELTLKGRRRAVFEELTEEVEVEDLTDKDAASADDDESEDEDNGDEEGAEDEDGDEESEADESAEAPAAPKPAEGDDEGEAEDEAKAEAKTEDRAKDEAEDKDEGGAKKKKKRRRRRRRKKAAPPPPELTCPPHKDFWEVWANKYSAADFERPEDQVEEDESASDHDEAPREPARASAEDEQASDVPLIAEPPAEDSLVRVDLNIGRRHGHKASHVRALLKRVTGLHGKAVKDLTVRDGNSLFRMDIQHFETVVARLDGTVIEKVELELVRVDVGEAGPKLRVSEADGKAEDEQAKGDAKAKAKQDEPDGKDKAKAKKDEPKAKDKAEGKQAKPKPKSKQAKGDGEADAEQASEQDAAEATEPKAGKSAAPGGEAVAAAPDES